MNDYFSAAAPKNKRGRPPKNKGRGRPRDNKSPATPPPHIQNSLPDISTTNENVDDSIRAAEEAEEEDEDVDADDDDVDAPKKKKTQTNWDAHPHRTKLEKTTND